MEMGASLVEYRNRLRLRGFFDQVEGGETNLIRAALAAGFGSYAQFHRVYRQLVGGTPRDVTLRRRAQS
jgi:transcriptional regulator GlxA family with amidase domain